MRSLDRDGVGHPVEHAVRVIFQHRKLALNHYNRAFNNFCVNGQLVKS